MIDNSPSDRVLRGSKLAKAIDVLILLFAWIGLFGFLAVLCMALPQRWRELWVALSTVASVFLLAALVILRSRLALAQFDRTMDEIEREMEEESQHEGGEGR